MKFYSGTHSGTAVSDLETVNFSIIGKRGKIWGGRRFEDNRPKPVETGKGIRRIHN